MDLELSKLFLGAIIGLVIGAFARPLQHWAFRLFYRPRLQIPFNNDDPSHIVPTIDTSGTRLIYLRVAIRNVGNEAAKNVRELVTGLTLQTRQQRNFLFQSEVLDVLFALTHATSADIPPQTFRPADICRLVCRVTVDLQFLFLATPNYFPTNTLCEGQYKLIVRATGENCSTVVETVKFEWDGKTEIKFVD